MHLSEDDLVLHYYGELDAAGEARATSHLADCPRCRADYAALQGVLAYVEAAPAPVPNGDFEATLWARMEPSLPARRGGRTTGAALSPAWLAMAAAILVLVAGAFFAGRISHRTAPPPSALSAGDLRERILLVDLGEHLDRSQMMLVELVAGDEPDALDMVLERGRAEELVAANRLYRQTAAATGEVAIGELLDDLERLLVDLAASPDHLSPEEMDAVRSRVEAEGLLFKVRVLSAAVRQRQQQQVLARAGQSS